MKKHTIGGGSFGILLVGFFIARPEMMSFLDWNGLKVEEETGGCWCLKVSKKSPHRTGEKSDDPICMFRMFLFFSDAGHKLQFA